MKLDHKNKRVIPKARFDYNGKTGFYDQMDVKFKPFDLQKSAESMNYQEYVKK